MCVGLDVRRLRVPLLDAVHEEGRAGTRHVVPPVELTGELALPLVHDEVERDRGGGDVGEGRECRDIHRIRLLRGRQLRIVRRTHAEHVDVRRRGRRLAQPRFASAASR